VHTARLQRCTTSSQVDMAYIISSLQNSQQKLVDHFKADEQRRAGFQRYMKNSRFKEVMARSRIATVPARSTRGGSKVHGPPPGQDAVEYYQERLERRREKSRMLWAGSSRPSTPASTPTGQAAQVEPKPPTTNHGASTYARTERPWTARAQSRKAVQMTAEDVREALKNVYSTTDTTGRRRAPYVHYDGRASAGLPLRLDEMEFKKSERAAKGDTARAQESTNSRPAQVERAVRSSSAASSVPTDAPGQDETWQPGRKPQPPERRPEKQAATAAAPPDHTRRVRPSWRPDKAAWEPIADRDSNLDRWAAAAPCRERPGGESRDVRVPDGWPFRILHPRSEQERDVGSGGYRPDVCPSSARSMNAEATTTRSRNLDAKPEGGGWESSDPEAVVEARATHAWSVAPPITEGGRVEYRYYSESQRPASAVALTADRQLDAPSRASVSPQPVRRFVFPSKGGPRAVQSAR
jgi:hypothetical protein